MKEGGCCLRDVVANHLQAQESVSVIVTHYTGLVSIPVCKTCVYQEDIKTYFSPEMEHSWEKVFLESELIFQCLWIGSLIPAVQSRLYFCVVTVTDLGKDVYRSSSHRNLQKDWKCLRSSDSNLYYCGNALAGLGKTAWRERWMPKVLTAMCTSLFVLSLPKHQAHNSEQLLLWHEGDVFCASGHDSQHHTQPLQPGDGIWTKSSSYKLAAWMKPSIGKAFVDHFSSISLSKALSTIVGSRHNGDFLNLNFMHGSLLKTQICGACGAAFVAHFLLAMLIFSLLVEIQKDYSETVSKFGLGLISWTH